MKKLLAVSAAFICLVSYGFAGDSFKGPEGNNNSIGADYGGVDVATNSFYVGLATVPSEMGERGAGYLGFYQSTTSVNGEYAKSKWRVYGVNFSTGLCFPASGPDFVSIQTSSGPASAAREVTRIYNFSITASTLASSGVCGGIQYTRWPIRVYGNLFWGVNFGFGPGSGANPYSRADLLYYKEKD